MAEVAFCRCQETAEGTLHLHHQSKMQNQKTSVSWCEFSPSMHLGGGLIVNGLSVLVPLYFDTNKTLINHAWHFRSKVLTVKKKKKEVYTAIALHSIQSLEPIFLPCWQRTLQQFLCYFKHPCFSEIANFVVPIISKLSVTRGKLEHTSPHLTPPPLTSFMKE